MMKLDQIPFSFFSSQGVNLSNYAIGDIVAESKVIPEGYTGIIKDNDTIFTTTGGKLDFIIKRASGSEIKFRKGIFSDDSGFINKILKEGDRVLIRLNDIGTGVVDIVWDGELKQVRHIIPESPLTSFDEEEL